VLCFEAYYINQFSSIKVILKSNHYLIKTRGYKYLRGYGVKRVKVYKSMDTQAVISVLRNNYRLTAFNHNLYNEYKLKPNFDEQKFWDSLQYYELKKYYTLDNIELAVKISLSKAKAKKTISLSKFQNRRKCLEP